VADYFASDVHIRLDVPERSRRFAHFVNGLEPGQDTLTIVGDLCDFWYVARQHREREREREPRATAAFACPGLRALAGFRDRGGAVTILVGNHDAALGPFYATTLGLDLRAEPLDLTVHGLRVRLVHGHLLVARRNWKSGMESRVFHRAFAALPHLAARLLDYLRETVNQWNRRRIERRFYALFLNYASRCHGAADLVVIGHVHTPLDAAGSDPRMVVLGSWHEQSSYLKIDDSGAALIVETDDALISH
jgi:UDP-2,3-diacylglucosamine hydrolase